MNIISLRKTRFRYATNGVGIRKKERKKERKTERNTERKEGKIIHPWKEGKIIHP